MQQLSNCVRTLDAYYAASSTTLVSNTYTTGISSCQMTVPVNGYYNVCVHARQPAQSILALSHSLYLFRFKKGGNSGDVTIGLVRFSLQPS